MEYEIRNQRLRVLVRKKGMELSSISSNRSGTEYLWQGDPAIWAGQAPVLFPVIGALKKGKYIYKGRSYSMPKHGFIRHNDQILLEKQTDRSLTFLHTSDSETRKMYPFDFEFRVCYSLNDNELTAEHSVYNTGNADMLYSTGGHPAFNCPIAKDENYDDHLIKFEKNETLNTPRLNSEGLISDETELIMNNSSELPLTKKLFNKDALIFTEIRSQKVILFSRLSGPVLSMTFHDYPCFGIWAKPGASYVCLEPWAGLADYLNSDQKLKNKEGIIKLGAGMKRTHKYSIAILSEV